MIVFFASGSGVAKQGKCLMQPVEKTNAQIDVPQVASLPSPKPDSLPLGSDPGIVALSMLLAFFVTLAIKR